MTESDAHALDKREKEDRTKLLRSIRRNPSIDCFLELFRNNFIIKTLFFVI